MSKKLIPIVVTGIVALLTVSVFAFRHGYDARRKAQKGECTQKEYIKYVEHKCGDYVERRETLTINFEDCTMDIRGISS